jgi:hypothetical protein
VRNVLTRVTVRRSRHVFPNLRLRAAGECHAGSPHVATFMFCSWTRSDPAVDARTDPCGLTAPSSAGGEGAGAGF